jgi:hypothetical protein
MAPVNLSGKSAVSFWTKGDGRTYQVMLFTKGEGAMPLTQSFVAALEWRQITIPLSELGTDGSDLAGLMIAELALPGAFSFLIDDVRLESNSPLAGAGGQDEESATPALSSGGRADSSSRILLHISTSKTSPAVKRNSEGAWQIDGTSYLWLQGIHGTVSALGHEIGFKAGPTDLISRSKLGVQELVAAQYKRLTLTGDILWTPIEVDSSNSLLNPPPAILSKAKYNPVIITPEIGYRVVDNRHIQIDGLTGLRYWRIGADFTIAPAAGGGTLSKPVDWVDPLVGARIKVPVSNRLSATLWADAGGWGTGSQLDYQMVGALSYRLKSKWSLDTGWRYLYSDYSNSLLHSRVAQSGIFLGVTHSFKARRTAQFSDPRDSR